MRLFISPLNLIVTISAEALAGLERTEQWRC